MLQAVSTRSPKIKNGVYTFFIIPATFSLTGRGCIIKLRASAGLGRYCLQTAIDHILV